MGGTGVATLVRSGVLCGAEQAQHKPLGLGSSTLPHQPLGTVPRGARGLRRQWTAAKPRGDVSCNVLPFFLDLSLAFAPGMELFDAVKSSVDSEVVFQATLQVPAHHALACRLNAYGTPFAAPDLQAAAHELRDEDLEFAACLATPPDLDEQLSVNFGRVMSMLEKNQGQQAGQIATRAAQTRTDAGSSAGVQQAQLRSTQQAPQQAPKVLVSVDEAETTAAQLQRTNSAKKQPKLQSMLDSYGKRALQALLGLGYLLTVMHERTLGGTIKFSAATIISPTTSDGNHIKPRGSLSGQGMLASLRQFVRECPSLSPLSPSSSISRRTAAAAVAGAELAAAGSGGRLSTADSSGSTPRRPHLAGSFEAAWDRVLHPPLISSGGGGSFNSRGGAQGPIPACQGLQVQLSMSAPCRRMSMEWSSTPTSSPGTPISPAPQHLNNFLPQQQQQSAWGPFAAAAAAASAGGISAAAAAAAPGRASSPLGKATGGLLQQQQQQQALLDKTQDLGRGDVLDGALDEAIEQLQQQRLEPSATDLVTLGGDAATLGDTADSAFATASAAAAVDAAGGVDSTPPCTPVRPRPPLPLQHKQQQQQQVSGAGGVKSFYLPDQGPLTSPLYAPWTPGAATARHATPFGSPWVAVSSGGTTPHGYSGAVQEGSTAGGTAVNGSSSGSMPGTPQRMLLPVMSMRLTCQPAWQYNGSTAGEEGSTAGAEGSTAAEAAAAEGTGSSMACNGVDKANTKHTPAAAAAAAAGDVSEPSLALADFIAAADAASGHRNGTTDQHKPAVHMHQPTRDELQSRQHEKQLLQQQQQQQQQQEWTAGGEAEPWSAGSVLTGSPMSCSLPQGMWPTMSFSLVPVRLTPAASPKSPLGTKHASCPA